MQCNGIPCVTVVFVMFYVSHAWCLIELLYDFLHGIYLLCLRSRFFTMDLCCAGGFTIFIDLMFSCSACLFCTLHALLFDSLSSQCSFIHLTSGNFVVLPSFTHLCLVVRFSWPGIIVPLSCTLTYHTVTH